MRIWYSLLPFKYVERQGIKVKHGTWYGVDQELGTNNQPARHILRNTVYNNIDQIRIIQGRYLSAINDDNLAKGLISEEEYRSGEGEES